MPVLQSLKKSLPAFKGQTAPGFYTKSHPATHAPWEHDPVDFPSRRNRPILSAACDWLVVLLLFIGVQILFVAVTPATRYFRPDDPALNLPVVAETISSSITPLITILLPLVIIALFELLFFFDVWDFYHMALGYAQSTALSLFITAVLWVFFGSLRPHFIALCKPDLAKLVPGQMYYTPEELCSVPVKLNEFHAFPSGHASSAWSGFLYFSLYMCSKIKAFSPAAQFWKFVLFCLFPILAAMWITSTRVIDHNHTVAQVTVGSIIGILAALTGYYLNFPAMFTWHSHVPGRYAYNRTNTMDDPLDLPLNSSTQLRGSNNSSSRGLEQVRVQ